MSAASTSRFDAVIFDMDGVLVDSEAFICQAAIAMFGELGVQAQESDFLPFVGMGENRYLGGVRREVRGLLFRWSGIKREHTPSIWT